MNITPKQLNMLNRILNVDTNFEIRKLNIESHRLVNVLNKAEKQHARLQDRLEKLEA